MGRPFENGKNFFSLLQDFLSVVQVPEYRKKLKQLEAFF
jgi:hypothetical protein